MNKIKRMSVGEKPGSVIKRDGSVISGRGGLSGAEKPFDAMNNIVANLLLNLTRYRTSVSAQISARSFLRWIDKTSEYG